MIQKVANFVKSEFFFHHIPIKMDAGGIYLISHFAILRFEKHQDRINDILEKCQKSPKDISDKSGLTLVACGKNIYRESFYDFLTKSGVILTNCIVLTCSDIDSVSDISDDVDLYSIFTADAINYGKKFVDYFPINCYRFPYYLKSMSLDGGSDGVHVIELIYE